MQKIMFPEFVSGKKYVPPPDERWKLFVAIGGAVALFCTGFMAYWFYFSEDGPKEEGYGIEQPTDDYS